MVSSQEEKPIERGDCEREKGTAVPLVGVGTGGGCFGGGKCGGSRAESTTAAHGSGTTADRFPVSARRQVQRRINLKIFKFLFPLNKINLPRWRSYRLLVTSGAANSQQNTKFQFCF